MSKMTKSIWTVTQKQIWEEERWQIQFDKTAQNIMLNII